MSQNQYIKQYQKTQVETASQEAILIMLHDGIIQFLNKAKVAMDKKDIEETHKNLMGAQDILYEFIHTLDHDVNPELAKHLTNLYNYLISQLIEANMKQAQEPIDTVLEFIKDLKATWEQAIVNSNDAPSNPSQQEEADDEEEIEERVYDA